MPYAHSGVQYYDTAVCSTAVPHAQRNGGPANSVCGPAALALAAALRRLLRPCQPRPLPQYCTSPSANRQAAPSTGIQHAGTARCQSEQPACARPVPHSVR
eukprot:3287239-Rhodomonas_salina.1